MIHEMQNLSKYFKVKKNQALIYRSNVIYQITCNCGNNTTEKQSLT